MIRGNTYKQFLIKKWKEIRAGEIIKVYENQYFPCDMVLINSSADKGVCYVETKNLDGETNLKHKKAIKECFNISNNENDIIENFQDAEIECEKENEYIYKFNGKIKLNHKQYGLSEEQILLRGSSLRNTKWVYAIAVYTGHDTKVMMNSSKSKQKQSKIEKATNRYLVMGIII